MPPWMKKWVKVGVALIVLTLFLLQFRTTLYDYSSNEVRSALIATQSQFERLVKHKNRLESFGDGKQHTFSTFRKPSPLRPTIMPANYDEMEEEENVCELPEVVIWNEDVKKRKFSPMIDCSRLSPMGNLKWHENGTLTLDKDLLIRELVKFKNSNGTKSMVKDKKTQFLVFKDRVPTFRPDMMGNDDELFAQNLTCNYRVIPRIPGDKSNKPFIKSTKNQRPLNTPEDVEGVLEKGLNKTLMQVTCTFNETFVYQAYQYRDPPIEELLSTKDEESLTRIHQMSQAVKDKKALNFLFIIPDAVSRANSIRVIPKTLKVLADMKAVDLEKFHSVGVNTFPNLLPMMTGFSERELGGANSNFFDEYTPDMLLLQARDAGYLTYYSEDMYYSTFQYSKKGFNQTSADYSLTSYWTSMLGLSEPFCVDNRPLHEVWLDQLKRFIGKVVEKELPFFAFAKLNKLTHSDDKSLSYIDEHMAEFITGLHDTEILDRTVLVFFSDHGARLTGYRNTKYGRYEMRLPMFHYRLPYDNFDWYTDEMAENEAWNTQRITTFFDIHETMTYLMDKSRQAVGLEPLSQARYNFTRFFKFPRLDRPSNASVLRRKNLLLDRVPKDRTCSDAGIPASICICGGLDEVPDKSYEDFIQGTAVNAVKSLNKAIEKEGLKDKCSELLLKRVTAMRIYGDSDKKACLPERKSGKYKLKDVKKSLEATGKIMCKFLVELITLPNLASFEVTINQTLSIAGNTSDPSNKTEFVSVSQLGVWPPFRLNAYGSQSHCLGDSAAAFRPVCYCMKQLTHANMATNTSNRSTTTVLSEYGATQIHRDTATQKYKPPDIAVKT